MEPDTLIASGADGMSDKRLALIIPNCLPKAVFLRVSTFLFWLLIVCDGVSVPLAIGAAGHDQTAQDARSFDSSMHQHYDAAFRFQAAGDLAQAGMQYKLFLADALHELGNGRADIREYARALPLYEDAIGLAPADFILYLDYARAALDAGDPTKARVLAQDALNLHAKSAAPSQVANAHMIIGSALRKTAAYSEGADQFKVAVAIDPSFDNMYTLGVAYLALPDVASANKVFSEVLAKFGSTAAMHMKLGVAYGEAGYPDQAIQEFKKAIAKDDRLPGAHYALGASYINKSSEAGFPLAEPELRRELAIQPNDPLTYPQLGRIAMSQHRFHEAEMDLQMATVLSPQNPANFFLLGELYVEMQRPADAEKALRKAIDETTDPALSHYDIQRAHYRLGRLLVDGGKVEEGKKELDIAQDMLMRSRLQDESKMAGKPAISAVLSTTRAATPKEVAAEETFEKKIGPLMAGCYSNLGGIAAIDKDYAQAADDYEHASHWDPALKGVDDSWGRAAFAAHQYTQALGPLGRALAVHPEDVPLRSMLGISQYETQNYAKALGTLQPIERYLHPIPLLAFAYAESMVKTGDFQHGSDWLEALVQTDPGNAKLHRALGEAYAGSGEHAKAEGELRTAIKLNPNDTVTKYLLALSLIARGQKPEAEALLAGLVNAGPQDAQIYYHLGQLQLERGDEKAAVGNLEVAAKMTPEDETIHQALAEAYRKNDQPKEAERESERLQALQTRHTRVPFPDANAPADSVSPKPNY
jgi:tetratricopeptide (TPR) repeat protein